MLHAFWREEPLIMLMEADVWTVASSVVVFLWCLLVAGSRHGLFRFLRVLQLLAIAAFISLLFVAYRPIGLGRVLSDLLAATPAWTALGALAGMAFGRRWRLARQSPGRSRIMPAGATTLALGLGILVAACSPIVRNGRGPETPRHPDPFGSQWVSVDPSLQFDDYWASLTTANQILFEEVGGRGPRSELRPICYCGAQIGADRIPAHVVQALVAVEDRRFLFHRGFDPIGFSRAALLSGGEQGGSTITQQLVKNTILTPDRSLVRKLEEIRIAYALESRLDKKEIVARYLNRMVFGHDKGRMIVGIEQAARLYFGKTAADLNVYEGAVLVGLLKAPTAFNPAEHPGRANQRARVVLQAMQREGFLAEADRERALTIGARPGRLEPIWPETRPYMFSVMAGLKAALPRFRPRPGIRIPITLQIETQWRAQRALETALARLTSDRSIEAGAVIISDGRIRAMVGGRDHARSQVNHAMQRRQPASTFKPFVYLAAIEAGLVRGFSLFGRSLGLPLSPAAALAVSDNETAKALAARVGIERVRAVARRLGVKSPLRADASLALGASEVTLVELTAAYQAFANGGFHFEPFGFYGVADSRGNVLAWLKDRPLRKLRVISAPDAKLMRRLLRHVVIAGTGRAAAAIADAGGKTGTSDHNRDALFVGFTRNHVTGVWIGKDDGSSTGTFTGAMAAGIWAAIEKALAR